MANVINQLESKRLNTSGKSLDKSYPAQQYDMIDTPLLLLFEGPSYPYNIRKTTLPGCNVSKIKHIKKGNKTPCVF